MLVLVICFPNWNWNWAQELSAKVFILILRSCFTLRYIHDKHTVGIQYTYVPILYTCMFLAQSKAKQTCREHAKSNQKRSRTLSLGGDSATHLNTSSTSVEPGLALDLTHVLCTCDLILVIPTSRHGVPSLLASSSANCAGQIVLRWMMKEVGNVANWNQESIEKVTFSRCIYPKTVTEFFFTQAFSQGLSIRVTPYYILIQHMQGWSTIALGPGAKT